MRNDQISSSWAPLSTNFGGIILIFHAGSDSAIKSGWLSSQNQQTPTDPYQGVPWDTPTTTGYTQNHLYMAPKIPGGSPGGGRGGSSGGQPRVYPGVFPGCGGVPWGVPPRFPRGRPGPPHTLTPKHHTENLPKSKQNDPNLVVPTAKPGAPCWRWSVPAG